MRADTAIYTAFEDSESTQPGSPERALMFAILRTAMEDIQKSGELYRDARHFLLANDEHYLFSFLSICNHLHLCPKTIRRICGMQSESASRPQLAA